MRLGNIARYALSDLRHRPGATFLNVAAVALAAGYILVLGFYGASIHRYQGEVLERSLPTRIVASVPDVTNAQLRLTDKRMAELASLEDVELVFPRVELNVRVSIASDRAVDLAAEGTVPGDPAISGERLAWGSGLSGDALHEIVLAQPLFEKLGGLAGAAPSPSRLTLEVGRTVAGREEVQRLELAIAGLLRYQDAERVYLPVELLDTLDLWCTNKIADLSGSESVRSRYPSAWAYSPPSGVGRVGAEIGALGVEAAEAGELEVVRARGDVWAVLERDDGAAPTAEDVATARAAVAGLELHEVVVGGVAGREVIALGPDDPRWSLAPERADEAAPEALLAGPDAGGGFSALGVATATLPDSMVVDAEAVLDLETFRWLTFDLASSDAVEDFTLVETEDHVAGLALGGLRDAAPDFDKELSWRFLRQNTSGPLVGMPEVLAELGATPGLQVAPWYETRVSIAFEDSARTPSVRARFLPRELFRRLCGDPRAAFEPGACIWVSELGPTPAAVWLVDDRSSVHYRMPVRRHLRIPGVAEGLWLSEGLDPLYDDELSRRPFDHVGGVVAWGPWSSMTAHLARDAELAWAVDPVHSNVPEVYAALLDGDAAEVAGRLGAGAERYVLTTFRGVRVRTGATGEPLVLVGDDQTGRVSSRAIHLRPGLAGTGESVVVRTADWLSGELRASDARRFPPRLAVVPEAVLRAAAFESSTRVVAPTGELRHDARFVDALDFVTAERDLAEHGLVLRSLVPLERTTWTRFEVTDADSPDGLVGPDLVSVLAMSPPTFVAAHPRMSGETRLTGRDEPLPVVASDARDPGRFATPPLAGHWLRTGQGADQIVLPRTALGDDPAADPAAPLGRAVSARFARRLGGGGEESLTIPLEVVGVIEGDEARVPLELLASVQRWQEGKLVFNESRGVFESPAEVSSRSGYLRCNVFAEDSESVAAVVGRLQSMGYRTEDSLAQQESLRRLGRILAFLIGFFVLGCVLNASITVLVATMMNVKSKIFEIGILRAHGVRAREVVGIFASQGLAIGALAFLSSVAVVALVEPLLRGPVRQAFSLDADSVLTGSPFTGGLWWLSATALAVALAFSIGGVVLPATFACRLAPVEALRRRE